MSEIQKSSLPPVNIPMGKDQNGRRPLLPLLRPNCSLLNQNGRRPSLPLLRMSSSIRSLSTKGETEEDSESKSAEDGGEAAEEEDNGLAETVIEVNEGAVVLEAFGIGWTGTVRIALRGFCLQGIHESKSDPFLRISRIDETGDSVLICQTEVEFNKIFPTWKPLLFDMSKTGGRDNPLLIECFDFDKCGHHQLMGKIQKSVAELHNLYTARIGTHFDLSPPVQCHYGKVVRGQLFVDWFAVKSPPSLGDLCNCASLPKYQTVTGFTGAASDGSNTLDNPHYFHKTDPSGSSLSAHQQQAKKQQKEDLQKMVDEAVKQYIDASSATMKEIAESQLQHVKVSEMVIASAAQGTVSLIAYASFNAPSPSSHPPALWVVAGATVVAFTSSLTSFCLFAKKPNASSVLAKIGAVALITAVGGTLAMYVPYHFKWLITLAAAPPAVAVIYSL